MARKPADPAKKKTAEKKTPSPADTPQPPKAVSAVPAAESPAPVKTAPAGKKASPPRKEAAAVAQETPPAEKETPAAVKETPAAEKKAPTAKKTPAPAKEKAPASKKADAKGKPAAEKKPATSQKKPPVEKKQAQVSEEETVVEETAQATQEASSPVYSNLPRRSVAFIGSECHPFVKTGGLGDVMYALPRELVRLNCDVRVILPRYACIPKEYQDKMIYRGEFYMDLGNTGRNFYVGIMEYIWDGVVYDFIDNQEFFTLGNPYVNLIDDIPKYCFFSKAALAALNYLDWIPDIIHCHDWQAALVPVYLRTLFQSTPVARAKTILTIHNLRFQGIYNIPTIKYWTGLPDYVWQNGEWRCWLPWAVAVAVMLLLPVSQRQAAGHCQRH